MNTLRPPRGFTLIEMLVVLAVLGLLLSLVAPSYLHQVDRAQELALRHNLKAVRASLDQFRNYEARGAHCRDCVLALKPEQASA